MLKYDETPTIFADVDGTIIIWRNCPDPGDPFTGPDAQPEVNQPLVDRLKAFHAPGKTCLVVWSRAGADHAKRMCKLAGLVADAYLPKPRICVDDKPHTVTAWDSRGFTVLDPTFALDLEKIPRYS